METLVHSIDFHGINGPSQALSGLIQPGMNKTLKAETSGLFVYHCDGDNLNGIWDYIASGMYGGFIIHSKKNNQSKNYLFHLLGKFIIIGFVDSLKELTILLELFDMNKFLNNDPYLIN